MTHETIELWNGSGSGSGRRGRTDSDFGAALDDSVGRALHEHVGPVREVRGQRGPGVTRRRLRLRLRQPRLEPLRALWRALGHHVDAHTLAVARELERKLLLPQRLNRLVAVHRCTPQRKEPSHAFGQATGNSTCISRKYKNCMRESKESMETIRSGAMRHPLNILKYN